MSSFIIAVHIENQKKLSLPIPQLTNFIQQVFPTIWATIQFVTQMPTIFGFLPTNETLVWHEHFFISDQGNLFILENTFRQPFSVLDIDRNMTSKQCNQQTWAIWFIKNTQPPTFILYTKYYRSISSAAATLTIQLFGPFNIWVQSLTYDGRIITVLFFIQNSSVNATLSYSTELAKIEHKYQTINFHFFITIFEKFDRLLLLLKLLKSST